MITFFSLVYNSIDNLSHINIQLNPLTDKKHGTAKHKFTPEEDAKLIQLVKGDKPPGWNYIAKFIYIYIYIYKSTGLLPYNANL